MLYLNIVLLVAFNYSVSSSNNDEYWLKAGDRAFSQMQISQSIEYYSRAIENNPNNILAYLKRSQAYQADGQFLLAASDKQLAYKIDPVLFKVYMNMTNTQRKLEGYTSPNIKQEQ